MYIPPAPRENANMKLEENKNWREVPTANVRPYRFTHHDYTEEVEKRIQGLHGLKYVVYGYETCPTTGRPHLQGFLFFRLEKSGKQLIKELPGTILFTCNADAIANSAYCKKEGKIGYEWGTCPMSKEGKGNASVAIMAQCIAWAKEDKQDEIELNYPTVYMAHFNQWDRIYIKHQKKMVVKEHDGDMPGVWIVGPPGASKSGHARLIAQREYGCDDPYVKPCNNIWWTGYEFQNTVIFDDFDPTCAKLSYEFKTWVDRYAKWVRVHHNLAKINPEHFIVTSQYEIDECFEDPKTLSAMQRRFPKVIRLTGEDGDAWRAMKKRKFEDPTPEEIFGEEA